MKVTKGQSSSDLIPGTASHTLISGIKSGNIMYREHEDAVQVIQQRFQHLLPCAAPVFIDPGSYNGSQYQKTYQS